MVVEQLIKQDCRDPAKAHTAWGMESSLTNRAYYFVGEGLFVVVAMCVVWLVCLFAFLLTALVPWARVL